MKTAYPDKLLPLAALSRDFSIRESFLRAEQNEVTHVPVVEHLDAKILDALRQGGKLNMKDWDSCETAKCRGGWAIFFAGIPGELLLKSLGSYKHAAVLIYAASRPGKSVPSFFARHDDALEDIKACAAENPLPERNSAGESVKTMRDLSSG